jgi:hypothetical protein
VKVENIREQAKNQLFWSLMAPNMRLHDLVPVPEVEQGTLWAIPWVDPVPVNTPRFFNHHVMILHQH